MNDSQWDAKLKSFLKKTGDDFKRFGTDVKEEAQKLLTEVQDPKRQQKLRDGLKDVGVWAKKTAEEVATLVETGVKKAEGAIEKATDKANDFLVKPVGGETAPPAAGKKAAAPAATPPSPPPQMEEAPAPAPKKTVGKGAAKKKPAAKKGAAKKTIGKKSQES
ncbi:MAG: transcriptional regulator [Archangium sp.]|nr:transcriptional regulator [Archangium sp.]